jgi:excinuclease ABC subunit B
LDPIIEVRPTRNQVDDLMEEIHKRAAINERVLITTLTKRMAEELHAYFEKLDIRCNYIHSDVETLERVRIMEDLRAGVYDVLIGVNLLREGLDLPEVSLVAILDADKEGFLRNHRSLTQTAGRAARNINGLVIFYADKITRSMQMTIDETNRRREKQQAYNERMGLQPTQIIKELNSTLSSFSRNASEPKAYIETETHALVADPVVQHMSKPQLQKAIDKTRKEMYDAAKRLEFIEAARYRDDLQILEEQLAKLP